jgi:gliding motility-associated-like protein
MNQPHCRYFKCLLIHAMIIFFCAKGYAQCPPNIGFEAGSFEGWECSIGSISGVTGDITVMPSGPFPGRHSLLQNTYPQGLDIYGGFPINCPNGSGYSIQLGNSGTGRQAERVSYTFTIPSGQNNYSIIYNYAVVFQNPSHQVWEQPKFTANVYDVTNGAYIGCSSFSFSASANLPGFKESKFRDSVFCKAWTPVTIKLSGYAGRTIRLEFTTNDCTRGGHFGYAYVDVNENCSSPISGNIQCINDTAQNLTAPFGFAGYRWFNKDFSKVLGTNLSLPLNPVPLPNTVYAVEVTPYPDQGCIDTVYSTILAVNETIDLKVPTTPFVACESSGVDLTSKLVTTGSSPGLTLAYYEDYYIKATNPSGCTALKPVTVKISTYPVLSIVIPPNVIRPGYIDAATLIASNQAGMIFTYWKDSAATIPLPNPEAINRSGKYYIKATNEGGCSVVNSFVIVVAEPPLNAPNAFSPNGDGVHDVWEVPTLSLYPECSVEIYNRLGQLLFKSIGYSKAWDGKYNGIDQPVATYYYVIKPSAGMPTVGGSVTIVR